MITLTEEEMTLLCEAMNKMGCTVEDFLHVLTQQKVRNKNDFDS